MYEYSAFLIYLKKFIFIYVISLFAILKFSFWLQRNKASPRKNDKFMRE